MQRGLHQWYNGKNTFERMCTRKCPNLPDIYIGVSSVIVPRKYSRPEPLVSCGGSSCSFIGMHVLTAASVCRRPNALVGLRHRLPHSRVAAGVGDSGSAVGTHTQRLSMGGGRAQTQDGALQSLGGCLRPSFHPTLCKSPAPAAGCAGYPHALPRQQRNIVGGRRLQTSAGPAAASSRSHSGVVHRGVLAARRPAPRGSTACLEPFTAPHRCTSTDSVAQSRPKLPDRYDPAQVESDARYTEWQSSFAPLENNVSASER
jgi:hypothetical protein